jgi:hypothetical protein
LNNLPQNYKQKIAMGREIREMGQEFNAFLVPLWS